VVPWCSLADAKPNANVKVAERPEGGSRDTCRSRARAPQQARVNAPGQTRKPTVNRYFPVLL
jgi:hypothetical protein